MLRLLDPRLPIDRTRGSALPHWFQPDATAFVTFRTADSLPIALAERMQANRARWLRQMGVDPRDRDWRSRIRDLPEGRRVEFHRRFSDGFMALLDRGHGACPMANPVAANAVASAMRFHADDRFLLGDFVVMPNHVHALVAVNEGWTLRQVMESWKRFSARSINRLMGTKGRLWQAESFDHLVRNSGRLTGLRDYIAANPRRLNPGTFLHHRSPD